MLDTAPSDVDGCVHLCNGRVLAPTVGLDSATIPVLCLLDALEAADQRRVAEKVTHKDTAERKFDGRDAISRRLYFQACLAQDELWSAGVEFRISTTIVVL